MPEFGQIEITRIVAVSGSHCLRVVLARTSTPKPIAILDHSAQATLRARPEMTT